MPDAAAGGGGKLLGLLVITASPRSRAPSCWAFWSRLFVFVWCVVVVVSAAAGPAPPPPPSRPGNRRPTTSMSSATISRGTGRLQPQPQRGHVEELLSSRVSELDRLCSRLALRIRKLQQPQQEAAPACPPAPRCVFSDLDGTLLHAGSTLLEDGYVVEPYSPPITTDGEQRGDCCPVARLKAQWDWPVLHPQAPGTQPPRLAVLRLKEDPRVAAGHDHQHDGGADAPPLETLCLELPSLTAGAGYISLRTLELVQAIRAQGCDFVIITGARSSTYLKRRHSGLPVVDYEVVEGGGRMIRDPLAEWGPPTEEDSPLGEGMGGWDRQWAQEIGQGLSSLRAVKEELRQAGGWVLDDRDYLTSFRVDVQASSSLAQWQAVEQSLAGRGLSSSFNLGKADVYPCSSGKAQAVQRLMARLHLQPHECVALFDDDNDLGMAALCSTGRRIAVSITHPSVRKLVEEDSSVEQVGLPGVLGTEEALERVLHSLIGGGRPARTDKRQQQQQAAPMTD